MAGFRQRCWFLAAPFLAISCGINATAPACPDLALAFEIMNSGEFGDEQTAQQVAAHVRDALAADPTVPSLASVSEVYDHIAEDWSGLDVYPLDHQPFLDVARYMDEECGLVYDV